MNESQRVRDLAKQTLEYAHSDIMCKRRKLWTRHNSLHFTRPPVYVRLIPFDEILDPKELKCTDPYLRSLERMFLLNQYRMKLNDDFIIEPFLTVRAAVKTAPEGVFGLPAQLGEMPQKGGAAAYCPSIIEEEDIEKLYVLDYEVDENETMRRYDLLSNAVGGILEVEVDREGELCIMTQNDISFLLAHLRGLEQLMWDTYDRPEWLHRLLGFMRDKIIMNIEQTKAADGFRLINHRNQAMPYAEELSPPAAGKGGVGTGELWGYMSAEEFSPFSPEQFYEFMFQYQKPIIERYALIAYGCCEDITQKIDIIKSLKNLRRIAVPPFADVKGCAEQIGGDYVASWRPNPSTAVTRGVDEYVIRKELREVFDIFDSNKCAFDITLKDSETVSGDAMALINWTNIVREEINKRYGFDATV